MVERLQSHGLQSVRVLRLMSGLHPHGTSSQHDFREPPRTVAHWWARGLEAEEVGDRRRAASAYRQVLKLEPDHLEAHLNLGALLCEAGRAADAVRQYDEGLRQCPRSALLRFNRAIALEDLGRDRDALADYERCLALRPDLHDAHHNAALLLERLGDEPAATRHRAAIRAHGADAL